MSKHKHTPGPWTIERSIAGWIRTIDDDRGNAICYGDINEPNARLIAAAPELLEALRALTDHLAAVMGGPMVAGRGIEFSDGVEGIPTIKHARAVIAKAEGK